MTENKLHLKYYTGLRNPSGAVTLNSHTFVVADDEQNQLQVFDKAITRYPMQRINLSELFPDYVIDAPPLELDLEGATNLRDTYFWIGSHSTNRKGEFRSARHCLFALNFKVTGNGYLQAQAVSNKPYDRLIHDLGQDPRFEGFHLAKASTIAPKEPGELSIEGLAATPAGTLLIGFRNPLHDGKLKNEKYRHGKALLVEMLNPLEVMAGADAEFGDPISLDLGGKGIRDITWRKQQKYLVVAGPYSSEVDAELYWWSRKSGKTTRIANEAIAGLNLEAAIFYPGDSNNVQLLSDDGKLSTGKGFRSVVLNLADLTSPD